VLLRCVQFEGYLSCEMQQLTAIQDTMSDKGFVTVVCEVALSNMFGYSTDLRSSTQVRALRPGLSLRLTRCHRRCCARCAGPLAPL
jgi:hypothetical protein